MFDSKFPLRKCLIANCFLQKTTTVLAFHNHGLALTAACIVALFTIIVYISPQNYTNFPHSDTVAYRQSPTSRPEALLALKQKSS
jgi:hypothetical protein